MYVHCSELSETVGTCGSPSYKSLRMYTFATLCCTVPKSTLEAELVVNAGEDEHSRELTVAAIFNGLTVTL